MKFDFSGWATKNNLRCSDGRTIRENAFAEDDGAIVPLVWNHQHNDGFNVLGHAMLKNTKEGVRAFLKFNETDQGRNAKELVSHGDVRSLSIYANQLKQVGGDVMHGKIREVSLVLAGANPGAKIDPVALAHADNGEEVFTEVVISTDDPVDMYHADTDDSEEKENEEMVEHEELNEELTEEELAHAAKEPEEDGDDEETVQDVFDTLSEKQKTVVYAVIGAALDDSKKKDSDDEEEEKEVKHNVFENEPVTGSYLSHSDEEAIMSLARKSGSFQDALAFYCEQNELKHDDIAAASGFVQPPTEGNVTTLFPEYHNIGPAEPELITNDQGWISVVLNGVHKSPFSRIRTRQVDIRGIDALRAKGYVKGTKKKLTGNFVLAKRETDPQTIYVKNALHKDDITDITDFDYVAYMYKIDKMMLNEELATAILIGDGRDIGDEDKISPEHIRPVWTDDDLYTIHADIDFAEAKSELNGTNTGANFGDNFIHAEAMVNTCLYAREKYKGSGQPVMFIHPHELNIMLLARDLNGRRIYNGVNDIATALNVSKIVTVEQFENKTREVDSKTKKLLALMLNLSDYSVGSTKGGEVSHFTQFDIDYNQQKSLLETRVSGALIRPWSAIAIEEVVDPT